MAAGEALEKQKMRDVGAVSAPLILLADWVSSAQNFVQVFIWVYVLLIFAYVLMSWVRLPYSIWLQRIQRFLYDVCDPYLRLFRRILPPLGPLDLSPMVAVIVLFIVGRVVIALLDRAG
jgi:YggT family protein